MKKDEKITLWSERIHEFQSSGQTCKTWCQGKYVIIRTYRCYDNFEKTERTHGGKICR